LLKEALNLEDLGRVRYYYACCCLPFLFLLTFWISFLIFYSFLPFLLSSLSFSSSLLNLWNAVYFHAAEIVAVVDFEFAVVVAVVLQQQQQVVAMKTMTLLLTMMSSDYYSS
jgi:hypothetical protein